MIQRIQSLYLLFSMLLLSLLFFFPVAQINSILEIQVWITRTGDGLAINDTRLWLSVFTGITTAIILLQAYTLLSFKNRKRQQNLCRVAVFLLLSLVVLLFFGLDIMAKSLNVGDPMVSSVTQYEWPIYMPLISLLLTMMAMRRIRKDEALIRSADRLR